MVKRECGGKIRGHTKLSLITGSRRGLAIRFVYTATCATSANTTLSRCGDVFFTGCGSSVATLSVRFDLRLVTFVIGEVKTDRSIAYVFAFVSCDGTGFSRLQNENLLDATVERILVGCTDAKMVQFEVHFDEGTCYDFVYVACLDKCVSGEHAEWCRSITPLDVIKVASKVVCNRPLFGFLIHVVSR